MNFEQLIQRLLDGLAIISNHTDPNAQEVAAHSYSVMVPGLDYDTFSDDEVEEMQDNGWSWNEEMAGWVLPVIG
jgi:hypothetical protein